MTATIDDARQHTHARGPAAHELAAQWRRDFLELKEVFAGASRERDQRPGITHEGELEWVVFERNAMHDAVNRMRARLGKAPATAEQLKVAECSASGHIDYAQKYAIHCADIIHANT